MRIGAVCRLTSAAACVMGDVRVLWHRGKTKCRQGVTVSLVIRVVSAIERLDEIGRGAGGSIGGREGAGSGIIESMSRR